VSNPPILIEKRDLDEHELAYNPQAQLALEVVFSHSDGGLSSDLASLLDGAGFKYGMTRIDYLVGPGVDWSSLTGEVVAILGAAGGLSGMAAVLRAFFGRHKGKTVKFGKDGEVIQADGLGVDDIIRLIETLKKEEIVHAEIVDDEPDLRTTADGPETSAPKTATP
jgi:hypothetical protein